MKSLREFSSAVMQKHLLRAKLRQLVNKARVFGRTPDNVGEIKKGWGQYDAMKARAFAAQVFALRELASRSQRVVELGDFKHGEHGGHGVEFARGDYALASAEGVLSKLNPAFSLARSRSLTLGGAKAVTARVPRRGTAEVKKLADAVRWHRNNRKLALKNLPHNVNSEQGIFEKIYEGYPY